MKLWSRTITAALAITLVVTGCSMDDFLEPGALLGIDDGAGAGAKESLKVEATAEARLELTTGAALTVPKGAVDHSVMIGIERPEDSKAVSLVETLKSVKAVASAPYVLTPHGTQFQKDVRLEIPVSKSKDRALVVAWLEDENDREWKFLQDATIEGDVAVVTLKHFSVIIVLDRARAGLEMDAASEPDDAGVSAEAAAEDAGSAADAGDVVAADADAPDAGSVRDAGVDAKDASVRLDAGGPNTTPVDAGGSSSSDTGPIQVSDGGTSSIIDSGTGSVIDSGTQIDAALNVDAYIPQEAALADASTSIDTAIDVAPDAGIGLYEDAAICTPQPCDTSCGMLPDGCGGFIDCGGCGANGGVCGMYQPNVCSQPTQ